MRTLIWWGAGLAMFWGCEGEPGPRGCLFGPEMLAVGQRVDDPATCSRCTCHAPQSLGCAPLPGCGPDAGEVEDASSAPPRGPDMGVMVDAGEDAGPPPLEPPCPGAPPDREPCGRRPRQCAYGPPVRCCGAAFAPGETVCDCETGSYRCWDAAAECVAHEERSRCAPTLCPRYHALQALLSEEGTWQGDVLACDPGDMDPAWRARTLEALNTFRWMAGMPPVTHEPMLDDGAQACALTLNAQGEVTHDPDPDGACYSPESAVAARASNIAAVPALWALKLYMDDPGERNEAALPHRRWLLSSALGPVGIGSTSGWSCLWVAGGRGHAGRVGVGWPPEGPFPLAELAVVNQTGWTWQSDTIRLQGATVEVRRDDRPLPVQVQTLTDGYGSAYGVKFIPRGWVPEPGPYAVRITTHPPVEYTVEIVDCEPYRRP